jgi:general secretion pathway protein C
MDNSTMKNKTAFNIPKTVEARIVELSLQNPDFDAKRLSGLLAQEDSDVSVSSIQYILKRHGLENFEKRRARVKVKRAVEKLRAQTENPPPVPRVNEEKIIPPDVIPVSRAPAATRGRSSWGLTASCLLLFVLIVFSGLYAAQNIGRAISDPHTVPVTTQTPAENIPAAIEVAPPPLDNYRPIWERNLFNISQKEASAPVKESTHYNLSLAKQDIGLELVGTVVSDDPSLNRALIENLAVRSQGIYRVGNRIEHTLIKKILRDRIIIDAGRGDEVLMLSNPSITVTQIQDEDTTVTQQVDAKQSVGTIKKSGPRHRTISLSREAVETALSNIDQALDNVNITSGKVFNQPLGFRISSFEQDTIFSQLGLRNNDLVLGMNNQKISSPEEARAFFEKIREGGSLEVKVRRRARTITLHMSIE